jgi:hypothetical protein
MTVKTKKKVEIEVYNNGNPLCYEGRLLGCISEKEYLATIESEELQKKMLSVETTPCVAIADIDNIEDLRLVLAIKKKNNKEVTGKKLFITEPIDFVSNIVDTRDITLVGKKGSYIVVTESDVEVK